MEGLFQTKSSMVLVFKGERFGMSIEIVVDKSREIVAVNTELDETARWDGGVKVRILKDGKFASSVLVCDRDDAMETIKYWRVDQ